MGWFGLVISKSISYTCEPVWPVRSFVPFLTGAALSSPRSTAAAPAAATAPAGGAQQVPFVDPYRKCGFALSAPIRGGRKEIGLIEKWDLVSWPAMFCSGSVSRLPQERCLNGTILYWQIRMRQPEPPTHFVRESSYSRGEMIAQRGRVQFSRAEQWKQNPVSGKAIPVLGINQNGGWAFFGNCSTLIHVHCRNTHYPRFSFVLKTGMAFPKNEGFVFSVIVPNTPIFTWNSFPPSSNPIVKSDV